MTLLDVYFRKSISLSSECREVNLIRLQQQLKIKSLNKVETMRQTRAVLSKRNITQSTNVTIFKKQKEIHDINHILRNTLHQKYYFNNCISIKLVKKSATAAHTVNPDINIINGIVSIPFLY